VNAKDDNGIKISRGCNIAVWLEGDLKSGGWSVEQISQLSGWQEKKTASFLLGGNKINYSEYRIVSYIYFPIKVPHS